MPPDASGDGALAAVVLAAGLGTRLRPLTDLLPKALCPIDNVPLVDLAISRAAAFTDAIAVNVHAHADLMTAHLEGRVHLSYEPEPLGTAGALGKLRPWTDGRPVLVLNADAWSQDDLAALVDGWDGERIRLLVAYDSARADFDGVWRYAGAALLPASAVGVLEPQPSGLYEVAWSEAASRGRLDVLPTTRAFVDCGTPADYLAANLVATGGRGAVSPLASVDGEVDASVVLAGAHVGPSERLHHAVRLPDNRTLHPFEQ